MSAFVVGQRVKVVQSGDVRPEFVGREGFVSRLGGCSACAKFRLPCDVAAILDGDTFSLCGTTDNLVPLNRPMVFETSVEREIA